MPGRQNEVKLDSPEPGSRTLCGGATRLAAPARHHTTARANSAATDVTPAAVEPSHNLLAPPRRGHPARLSSPRQSRQRQTRATIPRITLYTPPRLYLFPISKHNAHLTRAHTCSNESERTQCRPLRPRVPQCQLRSCRVVLLHTLQERPAKLKDR